MKKSNLPGNKNTIILFSEKPVLNPDEVNEYPALSAKYSLYLNTLLYSNWIEILSEIKDEFELIYFLSATDMAYLPRYFSSHKENIKFYDIAAGDSLSVRLTKHAAGINAKTLILFSNTIGLSRKDITRIFGLLQSDEPSIVIGKTSRGKIIFLCAQGIDKDITDPILNSNRDYSTYLSSISGIDIFIYTIDNFLSISDFEDIKKLYIELSKKESLSYCSRKMHENFNDLFIEYKDLLNV